MLYPSSVLQRVQSVKSTVALPLPSSQCSLNREDIANLLPFSLISKMGQQLQYTSMAIIVRPTAAYWACDFIIQMDNAGELEEYKERIPEFIFKLYHILQQPQFEEYLCWHGDNEVAIRSVRKVEERVLPHFFRHRRLSSFVRQLNMYGFSKVPRLGLDRHTLYFRNSLFQKGNIKLLTKIKRNHKKTLTATPASEEHSQSVSIDQQLAQNAPLSQYKTYVRGIVEEMMKVISRVQGSQPETASLLQEAKAKCDELLEGEASQAVQAVQGEVSLNSAMSLEESLQNKNMMSTMRLVPVETVLFPSQRSFFQII